DQTPPQGDAMVVRQNTVGEDYFKAMGIPFVAGRTFSRQDTEQAQKVAVVSETMAQRFYPNSSPLGKHFGKGEGKRGEFEIIGVVKDVKYQSLKERPRPLVYYSIRQMTEPVSNLVLRVSGDTRTVIPAVRKAVSEV